jgi:hypothetical protein
MNRIVSRTYVILVACGLLPALLTLGHLRGPAGVGSAAARADAPAPPAAQAASRVYLPLVSRSYPPALSIRLGRPTVEHGIGLDFGGDADTALVRVGDPPQWVRRTGNGQVVPAPDGNQVGDYYLKLRVDDAAIFASAPTSRVLVQVEYWDAGTDSFELQYDATSGGPYGDGRFKGAGRVVKTNSGQFRLASFWLCDAYLANRMQDADLRLSDNGDGADSIRLVQLSLQPAGQQVINVDSCGANPWDDLPDSDAIQAGIDRACSGDTVTFTSGVNSPGYYGYVVDKTIFLVAQSARHDLAFTSTSPGNRALLRASSALKGFVVRLFARSSASDAGDIDNITLRNLNLDGGRSVRTCFGADGREDGVGDNWGSWLPECSEAGDAWCRAGTLAMDGAYAGGDAQQGYAAHPSAWSTGMRVEDVTIANTECGTALSLFAAASTIQRVTIDTAGDHVHGTGCALTDPDEPVGGWSDGITFMGPSNVITGNLILDPSDVGIVFFGGKDTRIVNNTVHVRGGNRGAFAGIAVHPWGFGDVSGVSVVGNHVLSEGSTTCGGIHAGIDLGTHMWGSGCVAVPAPAAVGNSNSCTNEPTPPGGALCAPGIVCQEWAHVAAGRTLTLSGNYVSGAHINYLVEGLDLNGALTESGNTSGAPRQTDWQSSQGCNGVTWGPLDRVAHHPALPGWSDVRVHCER